MYNISGISNEYIKSLEGKPANTSNLLTLARNIIADGNKWGQHYMRSTMEGNYYDPMFYERFYEPGKRPECKFCMVGAIDEVLRSNKEHMSHNDSFTKLGKKLAEAFGGTVLADIPKFNDAPHRTHAEVIAVFDKAIDDAKKAGD